MASEVEFSKQETNWFAVVPRIILLALLVLFFYSSHIRFFYMYAALTQIPISWGIKRLLVPRSVYISTELIRNAEFDKAIPEIDKALMYFDKHAWIDKYRILLLISSSKRSIKEILIINKVYCLSQTGHEEEAQTLYKSVIKQYPNKQANSLN
jgi:tetratricopeptide (TPR) repeat protein